jgi:spore germination cell wall hydrolase CwlJ-like protein
MALKKRISSILELDRDDFGQAVNWTARSLIAAAGVSVCLLVTALSATASVREEEARRSVDAALANEAELVAELANYLAGETAEARADFAAPEVKPALRAADLIEAGDSVADFVDFDFTELIVARMDADERRCLAQAIYFEAGSESRIGQLAVADVVLNRVASSVYPDTICEVVYQGSERKTGCQFTFTCDGSLKRAVNARRFQRAEELAGAVLAGIRAPASRNATHYHADYVSPSWAETLTPTAVIGAHKFYRFPRRVEIAEAPATM